MKIMSQETIFGLFTVTVDTHNHGKKIGDTITDNYGRKFKIESVAMTNSHEDTTFVLQPADEKMVIGEYVE